MRHVGHCIDHLGHLGHLCHFIGHLGALGHNCQEKVETSVWREGLSHSSATVLALSFLSHTALATKVDEKVRGGVYLSISMQFVVVHSTLTVSHSHAFYYIVRRAVTQALWELTKLEEVCSHTSHYSTPSAMKRIGPKRS